tara:strand:+ start:658 stop:927 length:270 start_codon:yes stop_codon:yes gene_type:complete
MNTREKSLLVAILLITAFFVSQQIETKENQRLLNGFPNNNEKVVNEDFPNDRILPSNQKNQTNWVVITSVIALIAGGAGFFLSKMNKQS